MNGKARIYPRRKWTIEANHNWVQISVWLVRHSDGTLQETNSAAEAYTAARDRTRESRLHYAH